MNDIIEQAIYVLGNDVDTDQIIPAENLVIPLDDPDSRARYGGLALSGVPGPQAGLPDGGLAFADATSNRSPYGIIVAGRNFGCGSSREHAPIALAEAGVQAVLASSYARIFYRNAIDGGYFPPLEVETELAEAIASGQLRSGDLLRIELGQARVTLVDSGQSFALRSMGAAGEIIAAGGLFAYARENPLD